MKKRNLKTEKRERNETYALKYKKDRAQRVKSPWIHWCRIPGHPSTCTVKTCPAK